MEIFVSTLLFTFVILLESAHSSSSSSSSSSRPHWLPRSISPERSSIPPLTRDFLQNLEKIKAHPNNEETSSSLSSSRSTVTSSQFRASPTSSKLRPSITRPPLPGTPPLPKKITLEPADIVIRDENFIARYHANGEFYQIDINGRAVMENYRAVEIFKTELRRGDILVRNSIAFGIYVQGAFYELPEDKRRKVIL